MWTPSPSTSTSLSISTLTSLFLAFPSLITASLDCKNAVAGGKHFDLSPLAGAHQVHKLYEPELPGGPTHNFTFTIDLCHKLQWAKGGSEKTECPQGTRICAHDEMEDAAGNKTLTPIAIAGDYKTRNSRTIDAQWSLLRDSQSNEDADKEGIRVALHGGRIPFDSKKGQDQMAVIEFLCDKDRTGLEGDEKDDGEKEDDGDGEKEEDDKLRKREEEQSTGKSLKLISFKKEEIKGKESGVLRLEWRTKYACEGESDKTRGSGGWGFFTWFIIILFLAVAAYLIFGSWLNYNRYGARGWDLLPHGDSIRDIPYILKDWARRVVNTIQGPGSRGGYSAV